MALAWVLTDEQAKGIYNAMYKWYNSPNNFPNYYNGSGVFFNFPNYTLDKLYYTIQALKNLYSLGWFSDNYTQRSSAINQIAATLYDVFAGQVDKSGIVKFCNWVYNFAKNNENAVKYFSGGNYNLLDTAGMILDEVLVKPISNVAENVEYFVEYPSLKSLLPDNKTLLKWGLLIGGGVLLWKFFENRAKIF